VSIVLEERAEAGLLQLGLSVAAVQLDSLAQQAAAKNWSYSHFLGALLDGELQARHDKRVTLNLQFAKFPYLKRMEEFDFSAQPSIDRRLIEELATGRYLTEGRNLLFLGPPGVGKTHLAIALGVTVAEMGHRVYFTAAMDLARKLTRAVDANRLHRELNALMQPKLLIIDEIGYCRSTRCRRACCSRSSADAIRRIRPSRSPAIKPLAIGARCSPRMP
jgi:DNA replication protein DnaC